MSKLKFDDDRDPYVKVGPGSGSFEAGIRLFMRVSAPMIFEAKRRRFFAPTPTRSARKRRGKLLERRKTMEAPTSKF